MFNFNSIDVVIDLQASEKVFNISIDELAKPKYELAMKHI